MNIEKILLNLSIRFEEFYKTWLSDNEDFDASWMDPKKWKETRCNNVKTI